MRVKAVLMDLDGTVVKLKYRYAKAKTEVFRMLRLKGIPADILNPKLSLYENLKIVGEHLRARRSAGSYQSLLMESLRIAERFEVEAALKAEPMDGVYETLKALQSMKLKLAIVTNSCLRAAELTLAKTGLKQMFHLIVSRDDVRLMKPSPKPITYAVLRLKVGREETVMVGDSPVDMAAALKAGVQPIGVATGVGSEEALKAAGAKYVIAHITELPQLIRAIQG